MKRCGVDWLIWRRVPPDKLDRLLPPKVNRTAAWIVGLLGLLTLAAGGFLTSKRLQDLSQADASAALANLADVQLDRIAATDPLAISVVIPSTPQWARIRRSWGEPDFLIAAVSPVKSFCYCLAKLPVTITVADNADQIPRPPAGPPYAYSADCPTSTLKFKAAPGTKLTVSVAKNGTQPLPPGDLIIVGSWWNTKDKLVGIAVDEQLRDIANSGIVSGFVLLLGSWFIWRRFA
jgi:hypothetical protein